MGGPSDCFLGVRVHSCTNCPLHARHCNPSGDPTVSKSTCRVVDSLVWGQRGIEKSNKEMKKAISEGCEHSEGNEVGC